MKYEPADAHPCGSCLRWPECNGVEWPMCLPGVEKIVEAVKNGIVSPEEARAMLDTAATLEDRRKRGRIL